MLDESHILELPVVRVKARSESDVLTTPLASGNPDAVRKRIKGLRVVFLFAVVGGEYGTDRMLDIARISREEGCKVVSIVGIPMGFEPDRRKRAFDCLDILVDSSDRTILFDMDTVLKLTSGGLDLKIDAIFRISALATSYAVNCLAHLVEGPFFSTFPEKVYTFSYQADIDPAVAVENALESSTFPTDPAVGKVIIFVSSAFGPAQMESIFETVVSNTGITPDIIKRDDREDTRVAVFLPVDLSPVSPRVSRS